MQLNKNKTGLAVGALFALFHFFWLALIAVGAAQWYLDFIMDLHLIYNPFVVLTFDLVKGLLLLAITFGVGYILGWFYAAIWNRLHR